MIEPITPVTRMAWATAAHPGELFIALWRVAGSWQPADRAIFPQPLLTIRHQLAAAVTGDDGPTAVAALLAILEAEWPGDGRHLDRAMAGGLIIEAMRAIEEVFVALHPRTRMVAASFGAAISIPDWLDILERKRLRDGSYVEADGHRLIPSGPFSRHARGRAASAADSLQDHFAVLTVAPAESREQDRVIAIDMKAVGTDIMRGVPASKSIGRERVRFVPIAEDREDLAFKIYDRAGRPMLDVRPTIDSGARLLAALSDGGEIDIAMGPELTVPGGAEDQLRAGIAALTDLAPRLIVAGSGLSVECGPCGRAWNEARVFGRGGRLLWRQRKIWPFGMQQDAALRYGFPDPGDDGTLMEDIAGHSRLQIVDIDGFGRCLILICQDFEAHPVVEEIIARYQPDWVLTPVLDPGIKIPGWAHQRAVSLSKKSQARFLVGSSLTLSLHLTSPGPEPAVGLAIGPANPTSELDGAVAVSRAVALVTAAPGATPRWGDLRWGDGSAGWKRTSVDAT